MKVGSFFRGSFELKLPLWLLALTLFSLSNSAWGQTDKAAAEALFREGMRLSKSNDFKGACPKFEESLRLEPSLGAQYYLADCYERVGRTASAWANFSEVADKERLAGDTTKEKAARDRANSLEAKLSHLSVDVADRTLPGLTVRRGNIPVGSGQWGLSVPVDPGSYVLQASAPGYKDWSKSIEVPSGGTLNERVPALEVAPVAAAVPPAAPAPPPAVPPERNPAPSPAHVQQTVGAVVLVTGIVALGASGVLAVLAKSANSDSKRAGECTADDICSKTGLDDRKRAVSLADAATVVSIVGAASAITGGVLWLTAPHSHRDASADNATRLGLGLNCLFVRGNF